MLHILHVSIRYRNRINIMTQTHHDTNQPGNGSEAMSGWHLWILVFGVDFSGMLVQHEIPWLVCVCSNVIYSAVCSSRLCARFGPLWKISSMKSIVHIMNSSSCIKCLSSRFASMHNFCWYKLMITMLMIGLWSRCNILQHPTNA